MVRCSSWCFIIMFIDAWSFQCEMIACMCGDMVRASAWSVVISLVCGPVVLSALFDLVCLVWFRMLWTVCADWLVLVSSVWWFLSVLVCRCPYCPGQVVLLYQINSLALAPSRQRPQPPERPSKLMDARPQVHLTMGQDGSKVPASGIRGMTLTILWTHPGPL